MKFKISIVLFAGFCLSLSFAISQENEFILNHDELEPHQRSLVRFNHERHSDILDCNRCHHEYDENGNNTGEDGQSCSECHSKAGSKENPVSLMKAFHIQCKSCHEERISRGKSGGPIMCGACHRMR